MVHVVVLCLEGRAGGPNGLAFIKECRIMFIASLENIGSKDNAGHASLVAK